MRKEDFLIELDEKLEDKAMENPLPDNFKEMFLKAHENHYEKGGDCQCWNDE